MTQNIGMCQQMMRNQMAASQQIHGLGKQGLNDSYSQLAANQIKPKAAETVTVRAVEKERTNLLLPIIAFVLGAVLF